MTDNALAQFIEDFERALTWEFKLESCEIRLGSETPRSGNAGDENWEQIRLPLETASGLIRCVLARRSSGPLTEREQAKLPARLAIAAERIELMQAGSWPYAPVDEVETSHDRAHRERDEFESLLRAQQIVASQVETDATLTAIVVELERILSPVTAHIYTIDQMARTLVNRVRRFSGREYDDTFNEIPVGTGLLGSTIETGEALHVVHAHEDPRSFYPREVEPMIRLLGESVMLAPLKSVDRINGAIFVSRLGHRRFTEREFRLFKLFAGQVEAAFDKALRLDAERSSRRAAELLSSHSTKLAAVDSEAALLGSVTEAVQDLTEARCVSVSVLDRSGQGTISAIIVERGEVNISRSSKSRSLKTAAGRNGLHPRTVDDHDEVCPALASVITEEEFSIGLTAPIVGSTGVLGQICVATGEGRVDSRTLPEHLESLASITAVILERIRASDRASELEGTIDVLMRSSRIALDAGVDEDAVSELVSLLDGMVDARAISAWLSDTHLPADGVGELSLAAFRGPDELAGPFCRHELSAAIQALDDVWDCGAAVIPDVSDAPLPPEQLRQCRKLGIGAIAAFRLADPERDYGIVRVDYDSGSELPSGRQLRLLKGVVDQFSVGLGAIRMRDRWMDLYRSSVKALAATVDAKDPYTHRHSRNVAFYSRLLAKRLGLPEDQIQQIELAGLLHDIGKISIADRILSKTEPLDPQERMEMMAHPVRGAQILAGDEGLTELVPIVRHHHERHDGLGYPDGLSGSDIPTGATIVGVSDAVDTMLNERSYARRRTLDEVRSEVRAASGTQFSPEVAEALIEMIDESRELFRVSEDSGPVSLGQSAVTHDHLPVADVAQVRVISRVAQELSALTDLSTFVRGACAIVAEELGYDRVEICLDPLRPDSMSLGIVEDVSCGPVCRMLSQYVIEENRVVNVPDLSVLDEREPAAETGSALSVPLRVDEYIIGSLCVISERISSFSIVDEALLTVAANQLAAGLRVAQLHDQVKWTARHDALTLALNHGAFYEELSSAIDLHQESAEPVSLILCDVEGLKSVNDQLGHLAGDAILRSLVRRIREIVRGHDLIARYGGDEFAVITFGTSQEDASEIAAQLRASLEDSPLLGSGSTIQVTTGIAQVGEDSVSPAELVRIADHRLYATRGRR